MNETDASKSAPEAVTRKVSLAIIGSGFAGLAAAIEASLNLPEGKIIIVEKMRTPGGNSIMNAGQIAAVGSEAQELAGITDSVDLMMKDMMAAGVDLNHPDLVKQMVENSANVVKWTQDELGVQYRDRVTQLGGHSVPRTLSTMHASGRDIIEPMLNKIRSLPNVELSLATAFEKFLLGDDGRRVIGIRIKNRLDDHVETVLCEKGVILANGGFAADVAFRSIQNPSFHAKVRSTNQPGATAECLREALRIGVMPVQLSRIQLGPWTSPDEGGFGKVPFFALSAGLPYGVIIDPDTSKRFVNELGNRYERSMAILKRGHPAVCITDVDGAQHSLKKVEEMPKRAVKSFQTLDDLAVDYGMDPAILKDSITAYNDAVAIGKDSMFGKPFRDDLKAIKTPPFYAVRLWPKVHHCMGGVYINPQTEVLNIDGEIIVGLFAAGEAAGGVHGGDRLGSVSMVDCIFYGRLAGRNAATAK